jgi:cysteinyl-tRNA synthetase
METLHIYNSMARLKQKFEPLHPPKVGLYVCGPTVYNDVHLGNCRTFVSFDMMYRYLIHLGYTVRYVRNITDVGHLVGDVDEGEESKVDKQARVESKEPMEIVQKYTNGFHSMMQLLHTLPPSIEPTATGHLLEQIEMVQAIIKNGFAYIINGNVYFDTIKLFQVFPHYGQLSGKKVEDLLVESRDNLKNQSDKRASTDFAIWIKAADNHLMKWNTEWSLGFPGWHLECSAMSTKYLGKEFDIHGGGMDLQFPHHENEIAQNFAACGTSPARYWVHTNMMLLNGKKMSKSDGNNIFPNELFSGVNSLFSQAYSPMAFKFLLLQTHYRSTLDLTENGLESAQKAYQRLMKIYQTLLAISPQISTNIDTHHTINEFIKSVYAAINDDFNSPEVVALMFAIAPRINDGTISTADKSHLQQLQSIFKTFLFDIFGLIDETESNAQHQDTHLLNSTLDLIIKMRADARTRKDFATSDLIRDNLLQIGIQIKDGKNGATWEKI